MSVQTVQRSPEGMSHAEHQRRSGIPAELLKPGALKGGDGEVEGGVMFCCIGWITMAFMIVALVSAIFLLQGASPNQALLITTVVGTSLVALFGCLGSIAGCGAIAKGMENKNP